MTYNHHSNQSFLSLGWFTSVFNFSRKLAIVWGVHMVSFMLRDSPHDETLPLIIVLYIVHVCDLETDRNRDVIR